jgi:hypothetical protein
MGADKLREEIVRGGTLVRLLQRHTQVVMITMAQLILCNRVHRLDQRAARWLSTNTPSRSQGSRHPRVEAAGFVHAVWL